jgi:CheY-like chemotaxis protein
MLEVEGHEVESAADGDEGVSRHRQRPFDLVITDIVMPGKEGLETIAELHRGDRNLPIIAMSGSLDTPYLQAAKCFGAGRVLPKPYPREDLVKAVREMLDQAGV